MSDLRDFKFDFLKGLLISFVVWGHFLAIFVDVKSDPLWIFIHSFHMPLFVFISGYFAYNNVQRKFKTVLVNSLIHLILPQFIYIFFSLLYVLIFPQNDADLRTKNLLDIKKIYHLVSGAWYLWCIFFCLIFTNAIFQVTHDLKKVICISLFVFVVMNLFYKYLPGPVFKNQQFSRQLLFFILGLFYRHKKEIIDNKRKIVFLVSVLGYLILSYNYKLWWNYYYKVFWFVFSVPMFYILFSFLYDKLKNCHILLLLISKCLGQNSLGIYLMHCLIIGLIPLSFKLQSLELIYISTFIFSILLCCLCYILILLIKKNSILKLLFLGEKK